LYKHKGYCYRYLDDIIIVGNSRPEFLERLDSVMTTLEFFNFRLKGSKVTILGTSMKVLGKTLRDGKIYANDHVLKDLSEMNPENIKTKKNLKRFLGCVNYIAEHVPYVSEMVHELRQAGGGTNSQPVIWTEALKADLAKTKAKMSELLELYPVDPAKDIIGFIDSSFFANAGFFFQLEGKKKCFIKIFSRRRSDAENKRRPSSCYVELTGIVAAMTAATVELELCNKKIIIHTDSKSVVDLYNRMRRSGVPSQDRKINECFGKLMGFNYELQYISAEEPPLQFADYISRTSAASVPCDGCLICSSIDPGSDLFFTRIQDISNWVQEQKWEPEWVPSVPYTAFQVLDQPIYPHNLPKEITYPYGTDTGWMNTFMRNGDLKPIANRSESLMSMRFAAIHKEMQEFQNRTIDEIFQDLPLIFDWQMSDKTLNKTFEILSSGIDIPNKFPRVVTQIVSKKATLRDGVIAYPRRNMIGIEYTILPLPEKCKSLIVKVFHRTLGHGSMSKLENEIRNMFDIPNIRAEIKEFVSRCRECTMLRKSVTVARPLKDFDDETRSIKRIGVKILADEMHRTLPTAIQEGRATRSNLESKSMKMLFASEWLTKYCMAIPFPGHLTADKLRPMLIEIRDRLGATEASNVEIVIRMDGASTHASLVDDEELKQKGIKIELRSKNTGSKNDLAILDSRMGKFSPLLQQELMVPNATKLSAVNAAIRRYNFTIDHIGVRPTESFHGRMVDTGQTFAVPLDKLIEAQIKRRKLTRMCQENRLRKITKSRPLKFVPYKSGMTYTDKNAMPLKVGDIILVDFGETQKNNLRPFYKIVDCQEIKGGINWDDGLVATQKMDLENNRSDIHLWNFEWIRHVIDGNGEGITDETFNMLAKQELEFRLENSDKFCSADLSPLNWKKYQGDHVIITQIGSNFQ